MPENTGNKIGIKWITPPEINEDTFFRTGSAALGSLTVFEGVHHWCSHSSMPLCVPDSHAGVGLPESFRNWSNGPTLQGFIINLRVCCR